jgi:polysaccharide biosynthesis protein PslG
VALYIELTTFGYGELLVFVPREVGAVRKLRLVLPLIVVLLAVSAASAKAVARMPVGFFDDPSFRWAADPTANLASAQKANGSIIHILANWSTIAPTKPAHPLNGSDSAYHLSDIDALARSAQKYGFEVLLTIYGTPKWANGGKAPNYPPSNLSDLTQFSQMLALRYNGTNPGYGVVTRFSVWNEPNLGSFLSPQFSSTGKIVSPGTYAKLYMAAYKGIKAGNKVALVAAGETSNRGLNHHVPNATDSVAPATFAHLVSVANPKLPFDAWATHPYPSGAYALGPAQRVAYPNVGFSTMSRFGADLQKWFRRPVPIWVTEYGEQTKPEFPGPPAGASYAQQAVDVRKALNLAAASPYVQMFVWFIFRDSTSQTWFSGVETKSGTKKPSYTAYAATAKGMVGVDQYVTAGRRISVKVAVPIMTYYNAIGAKVGMTYYLNDGKKVVSIGQPLVPIEKGGMITVPVKAIASKGKTYTLTLVINDRHGYTERKTVLLLPSS